MIPLAEVPQVSGCGHGAGKGAQAWGRSGFCLRNLIPQNSNFQKCFPFLPIIPILEWIDPDPIWEARVARLIWYLGEGIIGENFGIDDTINQCVDCWGRRKKGKDRKRIRATLMSISFPCSRWHFYTACIDKVFQLRQSGWSGVPQDNWELPAHRIFKGRLHYRHSDDSK